MEGVPTSDAAQQAALKAQGSIPRHVAIIMDGNGRWAKTRGKIRVTGHYEGVESVRDITEACAQLGVEFLTLYAFSTENWNRPPSEVDALMTLLIHTIRREQKTLLDSKVLLRAIGDIDALPEACRNVLEESDKENPADYRMILTLALSYSGRWDILHATRELARQAREGRLDPDAIDDALFSAQLSTKNYPDPDLLIRTGGELRVSNFLLWQIAYSEMYLTETFWPDFRRPHLYEAIASYQQRDRRFGRVTS
ncbi:MAG: isoprenyl transferase [Rhodothermales bacterium]